MDSFFDGKSGIRHQKGRLGRSILNISSAGWVGIGQEARWRPISSEESKLRYSSLRVVK